ncbi:hypothetical protein GS597_05120 [Synechococcales cyanobacterium C]|uniref:DUF4388 domain-containing protein n=1 Tax=Petrachloros mirabilis ULC683 TaxID=2781853 RepID=A0A8K1ZYD5_9CYAN|nr:hypothetical protein [Petrachloros mirabilis]NCJ05902.1 hypothetical protein [Petrachloros mirabilis ULC683]
MDNGILIEAFVNSLKERKPVLLSNADLRIEPIGHTIQLLAKSEGLIATANLNGGEAQINVKATSPHWVHVHQILIESQLLPVKKSKVHGFYQYQPVEIPKDYEIHFADSLNLLQAWWSYKKPGKQQPLMGMLILNRGIWYPIRDLICHEGNLVIHTLGNQITLHPQEMLVWLHRTEAFAMAQATYPQDDEQVNLSAHSLSESSSTTDAKPIGDYFVDAGLLSPAQIEVILKDQASTGMRFGEIIVMRGWLKAQTIEFVMENVVMPQRLTLQKQQEYTQQRLARHQEDVSPLPAPEPKSRPSIHDRETLITYDAIDLNDFGEWGDGTEALSPASDL